MLNTYGIKIRPVPPRRHHKNSIEPKNRTIRSIFLRIKNENPKISDELASVRSIRISNDLYGSDTLSSFEMARGFTKPIHEGCKPIQLIMILL